MNESIFNETMQGYVDYALCDMGIELKELGFTPKQIEQVEGAFLNGLRWAKNDLTLSAARVYKRKY